MMKIFTIIFVALAFSLISVVSAGADALKPSPESIVTCLILGPGTYRVAGLSLPTSINAETCVQSISDVNISCALCIGSLEDQGCVTLDVVTGKIDEIPNVTYLLSCAKP